MRLLHVRHRCRVEARRRAGGGLTDSTRSRFASVVAAAWRRSRAGTVSSTGARWPKAATRDEQRQRRNDGCATRAPHRGTSVPARRCHGSRNKWRGWNGFHASSDHSPGPRSGRPWSLQTACRDYVRLPRRRGALSSSVRAARRPISRASGSVMPVNCVRPARERRSCFGRCRGAPRVAGAGIHRLRLHVLSASAVRS